MQRTDHRSFPESTIQGGQVFNFPRRSGHNEQPLSYPLYVSRERLVDSSLVPCCSSRLTARSEVFASDDYSDTMQVHSCAIDRTCSHSDPEVSAV